MTETKLTTEQSLKVRTRRAEVALGELAYEVTILKRKIGNGTAEAEDGRKSAELVATLSGHLGAIEILREQDEAEQSRL